MTMSSSQTLVSFQSIIVLFTLLFLGLIKPVDALAIRAYNSHPELDVADGLANIGGIGGVVGIVCAIRT
jgi:hypothetical protein